MVMMMMISLRAAASPASLGARSARPPPPFGGSAAALPRLVPSACCPGRRGAAGRALIHGGGRGRTYLRVEEEGRGGSIDINGETPEGKAGQALTRLFTFVAMRTIMSEIEGYDNEGGSAASSPIWQGLQEALVGGMGTDPIKELLESDSHEMRMTAVRVLEVRSAFAQDKFKWERMKECALADVEKDRARLIGDYMTRASMASIDEGELDAPLGRGEDLGP